MSPTGLLLASIAALVAFHGVFVLTLVALGRRSEARALARFIPDCLALFRRLLTDDRVPHARKLALVLLIGYLALPIDLIPDFIPLAGQLDDAILAALVLRFVLRSCGPALLDELWLGSASGLALIRRLAFRPREMRPVSRQAPSRG